MKNSILMLCLFALVSMNSVVFAAEKGTKEEAVALVGKCAQYIKDNGKEKALAEISNPKGIFFVKDLYIFAYDFTGEVQAIGQNQKLVGKNLIEMKDPDGVFVIKGLIEVVNKGGGWFPYKWTNPNTKAIGKKESYAIKIDDTLWIGAGVYID